MGGNYSKSELTQIVENTITATVQVQSSASTTGQFTNKVDVGDVYGTVDATQDMSASVTIKAEQVTQSVQDFQATLENEIKKKLEQKTETGSVGSNVSVNRDTLINKFTLDCSKALSNSLSLAVKAENACVAGTVHKGGVLTCNQFMTVDAMAEQLAETVLSDKAVSETKLQLEQLLEQSAEGLAGFLKALVAPLVILLVMMVVFAVVYRMVLSGGFGASSHRR